MLWVEVYLCFPFNHQITERNHRKLSDDKVRKLPKEDCFFFFLAQHGLLMALHLLDYISAEHLCVLGTRAVCLVSSTCAPLPWL